MTYFCALSHSSLGLQKNIKFVGLSPSWRGNKAGILFSNLPFKKAQTLDTIHATEFSFDFILISSFSLHFLLVQFCYWNSSAPGRGGCRQFKVLPLFFFRKVHCQQVAKTPPTPNYIFVFLHILFMIACLYLVFQKCELPAAGKSANCNLVFVYVCLFGFWISNIWNASSLQNCRKAKIEWFWINTLWPFLRYLDQPVWKVCWHFSLPLIPIYCAVAP